MWHSGLRFVGVAAADEKARPMMYENYLKFAAADPNNAAFDILQVDVVQQDSFAYFFKLHTGWD